MPSILRGRYPSTDGVVNPLRPHHFCLRPNSTLSHHLTLAGSIPSIHTSPTRARQEDLVKYLPRHTPILAGGR